MPRQRADDVKRIQDMIHRVQIGVGDGLNQNNDRVVLGRRLGAQDDDDATLTGTIAVEIVDAGIDRVLVIETPFQSAVGAEVEEVDQFARCV